jgi:hypothetical protein
MSDYPTSTTPIKTIGLREVCEVGGRHFKRRIGTQELEWIEYRSENTSPPPDKPLYLSLVHEKQGQGEPLHWSLFVAHENQLGSAYQVKGDAEYMIYEPSILDITSSASFLTLYQLAVVTEQQAMVVKEMQTANPLLEHPTGNLSRRIAKAGVCVLSLSWLEEALCQVQSFKWRDL